jgi:hypothetical protein
MNTYKAKSFVLFVIAFCCAFCGSKPGLKFANAFRVNFQSGARPKV